MYISSNFRGGRDKGKCHTSKGQTARDTKQCVQGSASVLALQQAMQVKDAMDGLRRHQWEDLLSATSI